MSTFDLILAIIFGLLGLAMLGYLLTILFAPLLSWSVTRRDTSKIEKLAKTLAQADQDIAAKKYDDALKVIEGAMIYDLLRSRELIIAAREHHQNLLSRCVVIAEDVDARIDNIGAVEQLFMQRAELMSLYLKAHEKYSSLAAKRESAGKSLPAWSKSDFERKIAEIKSELLGNQKQLQAELKKLFTAIRTPAPQNITYH